VRGVRAYSGNGQRVVSAAAPWRARPGLAVRSRRRSSPPHGTGRASLRRDKFLDASTLYFHVSITPFCHSQPGPQPDPAVSPTCDMCALWKARLDSPGHSAAAGGFPNACGDTPISPQRSLPKPPDAGDGGHGWSRDTGSGRDCIAFAAGVFWGTPRHRGKAEAVSGHTLCAIVS
jgi:hypothetical protein